jgi:hypothetical protein
MARHGKARYGYKGGNVHPLRTPITVSVEEDGGITIAGTIPALDLWERTDSRTIQGVPRGAGCYGLFRKGTLIYVGESDNLRERLGAHGPRFDEARFLRLDGAQRLLVEKALIWKFMPEENKETKRHDHRMSLKEEMAHA